MLNNLYAIFIVAPTGALMWKLQVRLLTYVRPAFVLKIVPSVVIYLSSIPDEDMQETSGAEEEVAPAKAVTLGDEVAAPPPPPPLKPKLMHSYG